MARRDEYYEDGNQSNRRRFSQGPSRDPYSRNEEDSRYRNRSNDFRGNEDWPQSRRDLSRNSQWDNTRENREWNNDRNYQNDRDRRYLNEHQEGDYSLRNNGLDEDYSWSQRSGGWGENPSQRSSWNRNTNFDFDTEEGWNSDQNRQNWDSDFNNRRTTGQGIGQRRNRW